MNESSEDSSEDSEIVSRFEKLDFVSLWKGREKVDLVEKNIVSHLLSFVDGRRILEVGPGNGRLTNVIQHYADEYVATDINTSFLKEVRDKSSKKNVLYIASNLYHLPFADKSFSTVAMVRVFNFVSRPFHVLEELSRIILPGGYLLISISPRPSLSTLIDDLKYRASYDHSIGQKIPSITFSNRDMSPVHPASYPTFAFKRAFIKNLFRKAGFKELTSISSGMEDYSLLRHFPARVFFNAGVVFRAVPIFPTTFFLIQKIDNEPTLLRAIDDVLQCPSCGSKLSASLDTNEISCGECGFFGSENDGIKDLTYVPKEARVAKEGD